MFEPEMANAPGGQPYRWVSGKPDNYSGFAERAICSAPITFALPDEFDPTAKQIAALETEKARALAAYQTCVAALNERISKLQAITYEPSES